ncbi:MAG: ribonuclease E/G [Lachnospiraceae bacterium]|nr:ribonuclease E/G [Lachnospiraceae bacterium]
MNQYIICKIQGIITSFLLENDRAIEIHCDREEDESILGNIYIGRIKNIARNIGAAFVEIGPDQVCYLPLDDFLNPVYTQKGSSDRPQMGDELFVQISREAIKTKYPSATTNLVFHGKYLLLTTGKTQISASAKLSKTEKQRLIELVKEIEEESEDFRTSTSADTEKEADRKCGWLIRTNAEGADRLTLQKDMLRQLQTWRTLLKEGSHRNLYSCVLPRPHAWITRLTDLYENSAERFLTDDRKIWQEAKEYLSICQPEDLSRLTLYQDTMQSLCKKYSLEKKLQDALSERVWLKSGGYLIIQPTEALTVIDVNTGKYEGNGKNRQKAFLKVNMEAAAEAAHQIRLRNISGIILIDFINMDAQEDNEELLKYLDGLLRNDPVRTVLVDMTRLSLVEITRMKKERPLYEHLDSFRKNQK